MKYNYITKILKDHYEEIYALANDTVEKSTQKKKKIKRKSVIIHL